MSGSAAAGAPTGARRALPRPPSEEFREFAAEAGGRLLHVAELLTGDADTARPLVRDALAETWLAWAGLRGADPYAHARQELVARFGRRPRHGGRTPSILAGAAELRALPPRERTVAVLRWFERLDPGQTAAVLGMPAEQVVELGDRAARRVLGAGGGPR